MRYVLYKSREDFDAKRAIGLFTKSKLLEYVWGNDVDGNYLVLEDSLFGKLHKIEDVSFLSGSWGQQRTRSDARLTSDFGAIEILSSDARQLVTKRLSALRDLLALSAGLARDAAASSDPAIRKEFDRISAEFPRVAMQQDFDALVGFLGHHAAWSESETSPIHWEMNGSEAKFFQREIGGTVFLYRNRFFAVAGSGSIEDKRRQLVASKSV